MLILWFLLMCLVLIIILGCQSLKRINSSTNPFVTVCTSGRAAHSFETNERSIEELKPFSEHMCQGSAEATIVGL